MRRPVHKAYVEEYADGPWPCFVATCARTGRRVYVYDTRWSETTESLIERALSTLGKWPQYTMVRRPPACDAEHEHA